MLEQMLKEESGQRPLAHALERRSQLEFRRLLEKLPAGAYMCDPDGLITYFNQRAVELWGRAPKLNDPEDRFCGSFKLFSPDGAPIRHDQCWMALALHNNVEYNGHEIIIERPDGYRLTTLAHANPIRNDAGRLLGAVNVLVDISDRKRAEESLRQTNDELERRVAERTVQLQQLNQRFLRAEEEERKRLSRELHDSAGQMTTALLINLSFLQRNLPPGSEALQADMDAVRELAYKIYDEVRSVSHMLRPPELEMMSLNDALSQLCQELSKLTQQPILYQGVAVPPLSDAIGITFYRFVQEALNNAVKHAEAGTVRVLLEYHQNHLRVTVADDGGGFDVAAAANSTVGGGVGLISMRERLEMLGGQMEILSTPGYGSRLVASYRIHKPKEPNN